MPRLFVAVWPPDDVLDRLAALPRPDVDGLRWTRREQWHVTLRFLGSVPDVAPVVAALGRLEITGSQAGLGPAVDRFGHGVLHVPVTGLADLAGAVERATSHLGSPTEDRPFAGHVTLARVARSAKVDLATVAGTRIDAHWTVSEFALVESRVSGGGRQYDSFARFPLLSS